MSSNKRQHERYEIVAQVELHGVDNGGDDDEVLVFTATNLSVAGMFFEASPDDHPEIAPGKRFGLTISLGQDSADNRTGAPPPPLEVRCTAKVIRRDLGKGGRPAGFGVCFEEIDGDNIAGLRQLIAHGSKK